MSADSSDDSKHPPLIGGEVTIDLIAGRHPNGDWIVERLLVNPQAETGTFQLLKSPVFVRGIAKGDVVRQLEQPQGAFEVLQRSGHLAVRVFSKQRFDETRQTALEQALTAEFEKLGGELEVKDDHVLIYTIHVSCGFRAIEDILERQLSEREDMTWYYGNVFDPETGEPLNWWQSLLSAT